MVPQQSEHPALPHGIREMLPCSVRLPELSGAGGVAFLSSGPSHHREERL